jgi:acetyltransferase-like isoleucine patch superfamily enzyme
VFGKNIFVLDYKNLIVGENSVINHEIYFDNYKKVIIGNGCDIGFRTCFVTGNHRLESDFIVNRPLDEINCKPIVVEDFVWIGANATILPGVTIGRGSVVAAGAVVTKDVEENSLVAGVPAKKLKSLEPIGNK